MDVISFSNHFGFPEMKKPAQSCKRPAASLKEKQPTHPDDEIRLFHREVIHLPATVADCREVVRQAIGKSIPNRRVEIAFQKLCVSNAIRDRFHCISCHPGTCQFKGTTSYDMNLGVVEVNCNALSRLVCQNSVVASTACHLMHVGFGFADVRIEAFNVKFLLLEV